MSSVTDSSQTTLNPTLAAELRCPICGSPFGGDGNSAASGERLVCRCGASFPVVGGIPRFVEQEHLASFGRQWNTYEVAHDDEDRATFEAKTGMTRASLAGLRVLDAGCGGGRYSKVAGEAGAIVRGVDHTTAVDKAAALCADLPNVAFAQADLKHLPFEPQSFDAVFSIGVMHHDVDTRAVFDSVARLVRPGGRFAVWLYRRNQAWQEWLNEAPAPPHVRMPPEKLERWCRVGAALGRRAACQQDAQQDRELQQPSGVGESRLRHVRLVRPGLSAPPHGGRAMRLVQGGRVRESEVLPPEKPGRSIAGSTSTTCSSAAA